MAATGQPTAKSLTDSANEAVAKQPEAIGHGCRRVATEGRVGLPDGPPPGGACPTFTGQYAGSLAGLRHVVGDGTPDRRDLKDPAPSNHAPVSRPVLASTVAYDVPTATTPESDPGAPLPIALLAAAVSPGESGANEESR